MSTESLQEDSGGPLVVDGISYIPSHVLLTGIPKYSIKDNRAFAVVDARGESPRATSQGSELGFYYNDTRYLSTWEMTFNGLSPVALASELRGDGNVLVVSMTNRDMPSLEGGERIPRDTFLIRRVLSLTEDRLIELIMIRNFDSRPHALQIEQWAGSRFDDVFEVRGFSRLKRGKLLSPDEMDEKGHPLTLLHYEGLDGVTRRTYIQRSFKAEKIRLSPYLAGYFTRQTIPPKEDLILRTVVSFDDRFSGKLQGRELDEVPLPELLELLSGGRKLGAFSGLRIESDNALFNRAIQNARLDIQMLLTREQDRLFYPYAGVPWFSAPFGRDGILTAYQLLPWYPHIAEGVLDYTLTTLGKSDDPFTDEQPGKVFHEMRRGEMASTREVPFIPYYGSVDSTPLCLILLHEYVAWSGNLKKLKGWWPAALQALSWIETWGDPDRDGFLEYEKRSPTGLINQGWKDSHDSVMHEDGRLAQAPIRLCEVQAYAYRARMGMSVLAKLLGDTELSSRLRLEALELKARFIERFWDPIRKFVYLALDGDSEPCSVLSSNMGHCLWSHVLRPDQAHFVSQHLLSPGLFSGYGIRTLSDTEKAYNPLSYHNGSVWPHDNSLILEGFRNYGQVRAVTELSEALIGVLETSRDLRLPELFCGFRKRGHEPPVPYEVACKPQAWAAGSVFLMLKSMLGLSMEGEQDYVVLNAPTLTQKIHSLEIDGLQGRDWEMDLRFRRSAGGTLVEVHRRRGKVRVLKVKGA